MDYTDDVEDVGAVSPAVVVAAAAAVVVAAAAVVAAVAFCHVYWCGPVRPGREYRCHQLPAQPSNTKCIFVCN